MCLIKFRYETLFYKIIWQKIKLICTKNEAKYAKSNKAEPYMKVLA